MTEEVLPVETAVRVESAKEKVIKNRQVDADRDPGHGQDLGQVVADLDPGPGHDLDQKAPDVGNIVVHRANQNPVLCHQ